MRPVISEQVKILTSINLERIYRRFAHQFLEPFDQYDTFAVIGMQTRGVHIARRVVNLIEQDFDVEVNFGMLDVTFYRDDVRTKKKMPNVKVTEIPFDLYNKDIVLVDDVLYTGRTVRSAMDALISFGRPQSIRFCCMIDRGHRELPVAPDYVGAHIPTHRHEMVRVHVRELDGEDAVYVIQNSEHEEDDGR